MESKLDSSANAAALEAHVASLEALDHVLEGLTSFENAVRADIHKRRAALLRMRESLELLLANIDRIERNHG